MVAVALFLGLLGWGLSRGLKSGWLARRAAGIAAVAMTVLQARDRIARPLSPE